MKHMLQIYGLAILILFAVLSVLSYGYGAGYLYLYWREWQIQTNIWVLLILVTFLHLILHGVWLGLKYYFQQEKRKIEQILEFKNLHPYEQLSVIWLLEGVMDQKTFVENTFSRSGLLKHIIHARLLYEEQHYDDALLQLEKSSATAFELAELQRISIYIAQQQGEKALTHLEFLSQHELSPWLMSLQSAYEAKFNELWGVFAVQYPWLYLKSTQYGHLQQDKKELWLNQLLVQFEQATVEDLQALQQRYLDLSDYIHERALHIQVLWLKLLARLPEMSLQQESLSLALLNQQFDQDVFYLWFQQQLLKQNPQYYDIEQHIERFEQKYLAQPIFSFVKWHIYMATQREAEAAALLDLFPQHALMNYLRIKSVLHDQPALIQQLNTVFETDTRFLKFSF